MTAKARHWRGRSPRWRRGAWRRAARPSDRLSGCTARPVQAVLVHRPRRPPRIARAPVARAARLIPLLLRLQEALAPPAAERLASAALADALDACTETLRRWSVRSRRGSLRTRTASPSTWTKTRRPPGLPTFAWSRCWPRRSLTRPAEAIRRLRWMPTRWTRRWPRRIRVAAGYRRAVFGADEVEAPPAGRRRVAAGATRSGGGVAGPVRPRPGAGPDGRAGRDRRRRTVVGCRRTAGRRLRPVGGAGGPVRPPGGSGTDAGDLHLAGRLRGHAGRPGAGGRPGAPSGAGSARARRTGGGRGPVPAGPRAIDDRAARRGAAGGRLVAATAARPLGVHAWAAGCAGEDSADDPGGVRHRAGQLARTTGGA